MGQAKKRRMCPAVQQEISSAECGGKRHLHCSCPPGCVFDPFAPANYTTLLEREDRADRLLLQRLTAEDPRAVGEIKTVAREKGPHGMHAATIWRLYFRRDAEGRTLVDRWEREGWTGLDNDERVFVQGKRQVRILLFEIRRILDAERFEAVDLLEPERPPRLFLDRSLGARACRFTTMLGWAYPLPHFWRLSGTALNLDDHSSLSPLERIEACIEHHGGPGGREERARWLAENMVQINDALTAAGLERRRRIAASLDMEWVATTYRLHVPSREACAVLLQDPDVELESPSREEEQEGYGEACVWFDPDDSPAQELAGLGGGGRVLGRVLMGPRQWRLQAMGRKQSDRLRRAFERRLGARVEFSRERRDDLGARIAADDPPYDHSLIPPKLLQEPATMEFGSSRMPSPPAGVTLRDHLAQVKLEYARTWADHSIPLLGGLAPRAAARDPKLREKVIELVKAQVRATDESNLQSGRMDDINFLVRELGLHEIDVPPPPVRSRVGQGGQAPDALREEWQRGSADEHPLASPGKPAPLRPAAPRLAGPPIDHEEALRRFQGVPNALIASEAGFRELRESESTLMEDLRDLTNLALDEDDFVVLAVYATTVWFALVPPGVRAPELDFQRMHRQYRETVARLMRHPPRVPGVLDEIVQGCSQPHILTLVISQMIFAVTEGGKQPDAAPKSVVAISIALRVLVDELDFVLRKT